MHAAIERGITFFDNCWDYNAGESETRMGKALAQNGYRSRVFLMTKFDGRTREAAAAQLDQSLRRLQTDHLDLWQIHENIRPDDAERVFAPGGAIEAIVAARKAGKVRYLGFTGHKNPDYHVHMFEVAARHEFTFDTVQMPLNVMDAHFESFEHKVIPVAQKTDTAVLAMKTFGDSYILDAHAVAPIEMLHYGMHLPVATVVTGIDTPEVLEQAVTAATTFRPMSAQQVAALLAKTQDLAKSGATERYKTTTTFDGTTHNPQWLTTANVS
jgi:aryl-alcohol dehydrogenase-like predicted oxidoreductase